MQFGFTIIRQAKKGGGRSGKAQKGQDLGYLSRDGATTFSFEHHTNHRFAKDKLFFENEDFIAGVDGVILNLDKLRKAYAISSWEALFIHLFKKYKNHTAAQLVGEFTGFFFHKKLERLHFFINQTASKKVFYHHQEAATIIAPSLQTISRFLIAKGQSITLNRTAAYTLLTSGGMYGNSTLMEGVFRLSAGEYLLENAKSFVINKYLDYNDTVINDKSEAETIARLEEYFEEALQLEYQKDEAYGHQHLATLSGGLDSRMNVFLAHKAGYQVSNLCFSQKDYADEVIAKAIAQHLDQELTFVPLDGGKYVFDFDENMNIYEGQIFYPTSAHFNYSIKKVDLKPFGLIHTGLLGDAILGTYISKPVTGPPDIKSKLISKHLYPKIETEMNRLASTFVSEDIFNLHQRFFNIIISGAWAMEQYTYLVSPFMHPEFIQACLSMPPKYKYQQKIYIKWINQYHRELTRFKWEATGFRPRHTWQRSLSRFSKKAIALWYQFQNKSHRLNMTPYEYWYQMNPEMPNFMNSIFENNIALLDGDKALSKDARALFEQGNAVEKTLVMTLLGGIQKLKIKV